MKEKCNCVYGQAGECPESSYDRDEYTSEQDCPNWWEPSYPDAVDGDIYLNPCFGDLWIVDGKQFILINDGYSTDIDGPEGFIKVGHVDGVINKKEV